MVGKIARGLHDRQFRASYLLDPKLKFVSGMAYCGIRLRADDGRVYSGRGLSTDVIGSSILAYISAVNKIVYEEAGE